MNESRSKIVLVDDNLATLTQGKNLLQEFYKVYTVQTVTAFFEYLERDMPDLILLDVGMSEMDGFEVIQRLKSDERYKDIPVIFLTSHSDEESERKGFALGAVDYITKPFSGPLLQKRITNQLLYMRVQNAVNDYSHDVESLAEEVYKANERAKILFDKMPFPCRLWDSDFKLIDCNEEAISLFGFKDKQECLARYFDEFPEFQPDGRRSMEKAKKYMEKVFKEGFCRLDWEYRALDGTLIPAELTLVRVKYNDGYAIAGYARDLREHNKMIEEMHHARVAEEASKAKTDFLAKMSHEIRTPMNVIIGMTELALRDKTAEAKNEHISMVKQAGLDLLEIINDILDFSKIEEGRIGIDPVDYSVSSLLNDIVSITRMRLADTEVLFAIKVDHKIPGTLYGDESRVRQAVLNILSNAVKYTIEGYISFTVRGEFIDDKTINIIFEVSDSGIGIKQENINHLFDDFAQFDFDLCKKARGIGLGLAITKSIVDIMGGNIQVRSEHGKGSTFTITLPQKYNSAKELAVIIRPEAKNVIIYEKREIYAEALVYSIRNLGMDTKLVTNEADLFREMETLQYDYLFIPFALLEENEKKIAELGQNIKMVILAEFGEAVSDTYQSVLSMPVYCTDIADMINGVTIKDFNTMNNDFVNFSAPDARILVVDDISTNLKVTKGLLLPYNIKVDLCKSGRAAIKAVASETYDLVFMDHRMLDMDGVEATKHIRAMGVDIPIIALTANAVAGVAEMYLKNGFNGFLFKPIDTIELNTILKKWIPVSKQKSVSGASTLRETDESTGERVEKNVNMEKSDTPSLIIAGVDVNKGLTVVGGRMEIYLEALEAFTSDMSEKTGEIEDCLASNDLSSYTTYVHGVKGAAATIGAIALSKAAEALEAAGKREDIEFIRENQEYFINNLKMVLENIKEAIEKPSNGNSSIEESISEDRSIKANLQVLKDAIDSFNIDTVYEMIEKLKISAKKRNTKVAITKISNSILSGDYDIASEQIESLIQECGV